MIEMAEGGDLQAIKEIGDRLDGKCAQTIERGDVPLEMRSDSELLCDYRKKSTLRFRLISYIGY